MRRLTRDDVTKAVAEADDVTVAKVIGTGATVDELAEAQAWIVNDESLMNAGKPLPSGRIGELVDILMELDAPEDDDKAAGPVVSGAWDVGLGTLTVATPLRSRVKTRGRCRLPSSMQLALRHRRLELCDLGGLRRLAVEGQHIALG